MAVFASPRPPIVRPSVASLAVMAIFASPGRSKCRSTHGTPIVSAFGRGTPPNAEIVHLSGKVGQVTKPLAGAGSEVVRFWPIVFGTTLAPVGSIIFAQKRTLSPTDGRTAYPRRVSASGIQSRLTHGKWRTEPSWALSRLLQRSCQTLSALLSSLQQCQSVVNEHEQPHLDTRTFQAVTAKPLQTAVDFEIGETPFHGLLA